MRLILIAKTAIDLVAAAGFAYRRNWPMALMFAGFAIADGAALMMEKR